MWLTDNRRIKRIYKNKLNMNTLTAIPARSDPTISLPNNLPGLLEWSVLGLIAIFLIKGIWKEYQESEKAERELTSKLIDRL
ncbi:hypothetical protein, partial [Gloeocapsopsis dulcis]